MENLAKNPYSQSVPMDNELKIHRRRYLQVSDAVPNATVRGICTEPDGFYPRKGRPDRLQHKPLVPLRRQMATPSVRCRRWRQTPYEGIICENKTPKSELIHPFFSMMHTPGANLFLSARPALSFGIQIKAKPAGMAISCLILMLIVEGIEEIWQDL